MSRRRGKPARRPVCRSRSGGVIDVYPSKVTGGHRGASFFLAFEAQVIGGVLAAADDALDAGFFGADDLPELAFESTRDAARQVLRRGG